MKFYKQLVIVVILLIQLAWFIHPRAGSSMGDPYRNQARIAALQSVESPSTATKAVAEKEMELLSQHVALRFFVVLAFNLLVDIVLIFLCWDLNLWRKCKWAAYL